MVERVTITPDELRVDGKLTMTRCEEPDLIVRIYRELIGGYQKFYKMDGLSRLGFVAAELLLDGVSDKSEMGVSLATRGGCAVTDEAFMATVRNDEEFYPSPALFVYTLPNIVCGEIAIRHGMHGETCVYMVSDSNEAASLTEFMPAGIVGFIDYMSPDNFICELFLKHS